MTNNLKKKKSRPKSAKMADLGYFKIGCKKNCILRKTILFMNLILGIFRKKLILKHFMQRTIPKRCVLGVFWTAQYVSEVYFTWRRLLFKLLTSFYGYNAFRCIYILLTLKNKQKKFPFTNSYFGDMFLNGISLNFCKIPRNVHFELKSVFSLSCKINFADLWSLHGAHHIFSFSHNYHKIPSSFKRRKPQLDPIFHFCSMERNVNPLHDHDNLIHIWSWK